MSPSCLSTSVTTCHSRINIRVPPVAAKTPSCLSCSAHVLLPLLLCTLVHWPWASPNTMPALATTLSHSWNILSQFPNSLQQLCSYSVSRSRLNHCFLRVISQVLPEGAGPPVKHSYHVLGLYFYKCHFTFTRDRFVSPNDFKFHEGWGFDCSGFPPSTLYPP